MKTLERLILEDDLNNVVLLAILNDRIIILDDDFFAGYDYLDHHVRLHYHDSYPNFRYGKKIVLICDSSDNLERLSPLLYDFQLPMAKLRKAFYNANICDFSYTHLYSNILKYEFLIRRLENKNYLEL